METLKVNSVKQSSRFDNIKAKAKELLLDGVQSTCGGIHLGLKYTIDGVEILEGTIVERMSGQVCSSVRKARQRATIKRQKEIREGYDLVRSRIRDYADLRFNRSDIDIVNESIEGDLL
jgi:hypothetical protein